MKRSAASAWNYLLSLEGEAEPTPAPSAVATAASSSSSSISKKQAMSPRSPSGSVSSMGSGNHAPNPVVDVHDLLHLNDGHRLVIGMVGLPARGKTHVALKIKNYMSWMGYAAKHFEVAASRRELIGAVESETFFDPQNEMGNEVRSHFRNLVSDQMVQWLKTSGQVAVYDTSNTTLTQRLLLKAKLRNSGLSKVRLIWIECGCENPEVIERNFFESTIQQEDFTGLDRDEAFAIFQKKMSHYETNYVSLDVDPTLDLEDSFVKLQMDKRRVLAHNVTGYLETKIVSFVMNIHSYPRTILLSRHGQSEYNRTDRIGGDSDLTELGREFGTSLQSYCDQVVPLANLVLWTSSAKRTIQTISAVQQHSPGATHVCWNALTEIDAGVCEGMTYKEVQNKMPLEYAERQKDKPNLCLWLLTVPYSGVCLGILRAHKRI
ncbi:6-phosphofructo-2-kinase/fructose-2,6-bisphosphatase 3 [Batrachochytrium salamandrivorans]|nr:6-phosphofructo-2-kinase/fructose-2,6-bisphosphatase 3 [Batrachochytrium salamandrivorans]